MIDIAKIRDSKGRASLSAALAKRNVDPKDIEQLAHLDETWRGLGVQIDELRAKKNAVNKEITAADTATRQQLIEQMKSVSAKEKELEASYNDIAAQREALWRSLPNIPLDDVPEGGEEDFVVVAESERKPPDSGKHYLDIAGQYIDVERAAKVSGSRFVYLTGKLARLEFALVSYVMDKLMQEGFTPVVPPVLVKEATMRGMGYLDHEGDEIYQTQDNLYLAGTSEQPIGALHMDEVLPIGQLPLRYVGFSTCFRREAGSHGKDVRGMLRVHQFDKVEMFSLVAPEKSAEEHEFILGQQRAILDDLELPYRVITIATGDLGNTAAKKYDIETWLPGEGQYRETNSASNTTDYQSRRLNIRFKAGDEAGFVHMLNGTAIAVGRILIAIIENHQQPDGSIRIPNILHPYLPFTEI